MDRTRIILAAAFVAVTMSALLSTLLLVNASPELFRFGFGLGLVVVAFVGARISIRIPSEAEFLEGSEDGSKSADHGAAGSSGLPTAAR